MAMRPARSGPMLPNREEGVKLQVLLVLGAGLDEYQALARDSVRAWSSD